MALSGNLDVRHLEVPEFPLHDEDGADEQRKTDHSRQMAKQRSIGAVLGFAAMIQAASAWRVSAERISAIVSGMP